VSVFGEHAFGMPMFSRPSIPMQEPGELGPHFDQRPTPPDFPGASIQGLGGQGGCGCGPTSPGLGGSTSVNLASAAAWNASKCASLGWSGHIVPTGDEPFLVWTARGGTADCGSRDLVQKAIGFQTYAKLTPDGKIGKNTVAALRALATGQPDPALVGKGGGVINKASMLPTSKKWILGIGVVLLVAGGVMMLGKR